VTVATAVVVVTFQLGSGSCRAGSPVVHEYTLTPWVGVNSPYLGMANGSYTFYNTTTGGGGTFGYGPARNGTVLGFAADAEWTIFSAAGTNCVGGYRGSPSYFYEGTGTWVWLVLSNLTNDSQEPAFFVNLSGTTPVYANNSFYHATGTVSTCGQGGKSLGLTAARIWVSVPFEYEGLTHFLNTTIPIIAHYQYYFPPDGGVWEVDNLSAPGGPGGGWAFSYSPCT